MTLGEQLGALAGGVLLIAGCIILMQHEAAAGKDAKIAELSGYVAGYQKAQKTELDLHVTQDKLNVQVTQAQAKIIHDDPQCANPQPLVDDFTAGIAGVRKAGAGDSAKP